MICPVSTRHDLYSNVEHLLLLAFPPEERRSTENQRIMTDTNPLFHANALLDNGFFAGLLTYWEFPRFIYIEHLATEPQIRGRGIGAKALAALENVKNLPVVLEVEPPVDDITRRRIGFYQRNGFVLWEKSPYLQPPYEPGYQPLSLYLMVKGKLNEALDFKEVRNSIHREVYEQTSPLK